MVMTKKLYGRWGVFRDEYGSMIKNRRLMKLITAGFISSLGSRISYFALLRKVYVLSGGRITDLGFLTIMQALPYMIFGVLAGIVIDKLPRKSIMVVSDILSGFITISIIFINNLGYIYVTAFLASFVYVFRNPAQSAFEPNLVDREDIPLLNSFESWVNNMIQIIGPAVGAAAVGFIGVQSAFIVDGISFFASAVIILTISIMEGHIRVNRDYDEGYLKGFLSGVSVMWKDIGLRLMLLIDLYITFAMSMQAPLLYIFTRETLKMGDRAELAWGMLLSSLGVGAAIGSLMLGILVKRYKNKFKLLLNILLFDSIFFTLFLLNRYFPISVVIFAFLGFIGTAHMIILNTVIQSIVKDSDRGKVFSTFAMLRSPVSILSIFIGTTAAAYITARNVLFIIAGAEAVIAVGLRATSAYREVEMEMDEI